MKLHNILALTLAACLSQAAFADGKGPKSPTDPTRHALPASEAGYTSVACYFGTPQDNKWEWGLTAGNDYYQLPGTWQETQFTDIEKFFSTAALSDIMTACANAQAHSGLSGFFAAFAAQKSAGSNYPIVINGTTELWPQY